MEDHRKKEDLEEEPIQETATDDAALKMRGKDPLAEEESIEEDDTAGD